ncbi:hypothetical protein TNIN_132692 [Trichonephila inaurata madagascariensis]|uniref:C2H2-type domain-containing protein n=1 Tax=Trichonephila inaurata madagascariensis TaxID=2747483 RepID=A0A8X6YP14_9ARAC|nr:hypothetical protein TNIN_132692 [Trichonephila inaurata madagascariensis]
MMTAFQTVLEKHGIPDGNFTKINGNCTLSRMQHNWEDSCIELPDQRMQSNTSVNIPRLTCRICDKIFSSKFRLLTHLETHNEVRRLYSCPHCSQSFTRLDNLRRHVKMIHKSESQSFLMPFIENI